MTIVRKPAAAGRFYPDDPRALETAVGDYLRAARPRVVRSAEAAPPMGIIVPHAGYVYSAPIAATAYACLEPYRDRFQRVVVMGPSHFVTVRGLAAPSADIFETPLGGIPVDTQAIEKLLALPQVEVLDSAHVREHSLEVHLPFLQATLGKFRLVPLTVGNASPDEVAEVIEQLSDDGTLFVVSSDLSHFHDYETSRRLDHATCKAIEELRLEELRGDRACGFKPIGGMLAVARDKGLMVRLLDLRSSGDTGGDRNRVVGYGAFIIEQSPRAAPRGFPPGAAGGLCGENALSRDDARTLLDIAAKSVAEGLKTRRALIVDIDQYPPALREPRATFVTLRIHGRLRGCMGAIRATEPLVVDVARNAYSAAFRDPRFPPVTDDELAELDYHVSILSEPEPIEFASEGDLLAQIRPGVDGLILHEGSKKGTLLPAVWDHLSDPDEFLAQLKIKAGLPRDYWSGTLRVERYTAQSVHS